MAVFQKLQRWQAEKKVSDTELAEKVGVHQSSISRAKAGLRVLNMRHQLKIQDITKTVSPADWAEFYAQTIDLREPKPLGAKKKSRVIVARAAQSKAESEAA